MNRQDAEKIITEYLKPIFGFALKRCKNDHDAEDLSQEIVLKAFRALLVKDDIDDMNKFIWTIAHNMLSNYYRDSAKGVIGVAIDEYADIIADPDSLLVDDDNSDSIRRLQSEIAYLSKLQRRIVIAYYFENRKQADIASELGMPLGTVKWHLFEAKKELKRGMDTMRKSSELKFNPIKFHSYGINGSSGTKSPDEFFRSTLSQNICYCVRNTAKTVGEIADDLGVSPVYVESEVEFLEKYKIGDEKMYLPPSRAEGLERINKYPKATQYGRQNPIYEQWNSEEQLLQFRKAWAKFVNRDLDICEVDERVDHRSYRARGINQIPTIHEGVSPKKKYVSTIIAIRRKRNVYIREHNQLLKDLAEAVKYLAMTVGLLISKVADGLESLRVDMLCLSYKASKTNEALHGCEKRVKAQKNSLARYKSASEQLAEKMTERETAESTLKRTPKLFASKRKELEAQIYRLSEEIAELQSETKYKQLEAENESLDKNKLQEMREHLRPVKDDEAAERIRKEFKKCYEDDFYKAQVEVSKLIGETPPESPERESREEAENRSIIKMLNRFRAQQQPREQTNKNKSRDDGAR